MQQSEAGTQLPDESALGPDTDAFYDALTALVRLYTLRDRDRVCGHGMSVTECYSLDALVRLGPLTISGLARELGVNKSTSSRTADALVAKGLVERRPDLADYKACRLVPTDAGLLRNAAVVADVKAEHRALLRTFAPAARREAVQLLREVTAAAAVRIRAAGSACCGEPARVPPGAGASVLTAAE